MGFTTDQYIILLLIFVAGLFIGLALHPGGKKWRARYDEEQARRKEAEAKAAAVQRDYDDFRARTPLHSGEVRNDLSEKPVYISPSETPPVTKA